MKILFLQLSDMHCQSDDILYNYKIDKAIISLKELGKFDKIFLVFSGDLANEADTNEYKVARRILGKLISNLSDVYDRGYIKTFIVPGNHDVSLNNRGQVYEEKSQQGIDRICIQETKRMKCFFEYANSKFCFLQNKLIDVHRINVDKKKIQICLLNSAPFSSLDKNDKERHHFPAYVGENMNRDDDTDLQIAVMHHSFEWFDWNSKQMLKEHLKSFDIVFFGHDHVAETVTLKNNNGTEINIIKGGEFAFEESVESSFNAVIYDTKTDEIDQYEFNWNTESKIFNMVSRGIRNKKRKLLSPLEHYINKLQEDKQGISDLILDYYTFPKLIPTGGFFADDTVETVDVDTFFYALSKDDMIRITGGRNTGKSSLLRFLYSKSTDYGYVPLLIEKRNYRDGNLLKLFKDMFDIQYGIDFELYEQYDRTKEIVFIDDVDLIENDKARENLLDYIVKSGRKIVFTTQENTQNVEEIAKEKLQDKVLSSLEIAYFYKEKRDELVTNVCKIRGKSNDDVEMICDSLDYMVQYQASLIILTPLSIIQYIKYFMTSDCRDNKGIKTISIVFETNIRNSIIECTAANKVNIYLSLLSYLADIMYFELRSEKISIEQLKNIVSSFNAKRKVIVNEKEFFLSCEKAQILRTDDLSFDVQFVDKNTFAYFIAKHINTEIEKDNTNQDKLVYVMTHICFGINDTIVLFLSYIRSNTNVMLNIAKTAIELLADYPEWEYDKNIPFLKQSNELPTSLPTEDEKKQIKKNTEDLERTQHNNIKFRNIFDYSEDDVNQQSFLIMRALRYTRLIGRILLDQYGSLDADEVEQISEALYILPQKIIYAILQPYQDHYEEVLNSLCDFVKNKMKNDKVSEDDIREALGQAGVILALNIMNDIAFNATNNQTIIALSSVEMKNKNYAIMRLIFKENSENTGEFIKYAIEMRKEYDADLFMRMIIAQVARKHILYSHHIDYKQINQLISGKVLDEKSKVNLLIDKKKIDEH